MKRSNYYTIFQSSPQTYRIHSPEGVYMELFVGTKKALLLDTGQGFGDLRSAVESVTQLPLIVVNTHGHYDHCNGNDQFIDCPIYMHPKDWPVYAHYCRTENRKPIIQGAKYKKESWHSDAVINILPEDFDEEAYLQPPTARLLPLEQDMLFDLGQLTLRVIETPGHTKGSCSLLREETGNLYIGDATNGHLVLAIFNATMKTYIHTLHQLKALDFKQLLPAHEAQWLPKAVLDDYLDCVTHPDPDNFVRASSPVRPDEQDYMYIRRGYTIRDVQKPGFASFIVKQPL